MSKRLRTQSPPTTGKSYQTYWENVLEESEWKRFHETWWGVAERKNPLDIDRGDRFIRIEQEGVLQQLHILGSGYLFERDEYKAFVNRIFHAYTTVPYSELYGCLLLGQPGIGKSVFLLYILLKCISTKRTILFTNCSGVTFMFDEDGVWSRLAADLRSPSAFPPTRILSLVDCPREKISLPIYVCDFYWSRMFFVAAVSPDKSRYHEVAKSPVVMWWMSPWSDEELLALTRNRGLKQFGTLTAVRSFMGDVSPCPRDIFIASQDPEKLNNSIREALNKFKSVAGIVDLMHDADSLSDAISNKIILARRIGPVSENSVTSDKYFVTFKTPKIRQEIMNKYLSTSLEEAKRLFQVCAGVGAYGAVFAGNLFEGLAIYFTCNGPRNSPEFLRFAKMAPAKTKSKLFPHRYVHEKSGYESTVIVHEDRRVLFEGPQNPKSYTLDNDTMEEGPWSSRERTSYTNFDDIPVDNKKYFLPSAHNNPLFDAFFYEVQSDKVIVWVLQMTVSRNHDGVSSGFGLVGNIKARAQDVYPDLTVEIKYVLVVAYQPGWNIQWNFADDFKNYQGDVYIQQMDLKLLGGGAFTPEDIYVDREITT